MSTNVQLATKAPKAECEVEQEPRTIPYTVDGEPQKTMEATLTAKKIMTAAGVDPKTHYLVQIAGQNEQVSFKGRTAEAIEMQDHLRFLSVSTGPTTVS